MDYTILTRRGDDAYNTDRSANRDLHIECL